MPFKIYEFKTLVSGISFSQEDVILDLGCATGVQTLCLGKKCRRIVGIDPDSDAIACARVFSSHARNGALAEFRCGTLEAVHFQSNCFDKVFSICVIEHIPNYEQVMAEVYRILKPGGMFVLSVDSLELIDDQEILEKHRKDHKVVKYFHSDELNAVLEKIGFRNVKVYPIFRSAFAKKLFVKGVKNGFSFNPISAIINYTVLSLTELHPRHKKGLFFVAKCKK